MYSYHRLPVTIVSLLTFISVLAFISLAWNAPALGAEPAETLVLVARPSLSDPIYGQAPAFAWSLQHRRGNNGAANISRIRQTAIAHKVR